MEDNMGNIDTNAYNKAKDILKVTVCDECQGEFVLTEDSILTTDTVAKESVLTLTYFVCPHCKRLYVIRIDTQKTKQMKFNYQLQAAKIKAYIDRGKVPSEAHLNRLDKYKRILDKEYSRLDSIYKGSFYQK